jgi:hypothetical protein
MTAGVRVRSPVALALAAAWTAALAQYPNSDPRSPMYPEYQRQQQEQQREKDKADKQRREEDAANAANYQAFMENQRKLQEKLSGDVERDRALFLNTPPVPP